jgi:hypothetical protein
MRLSERLGSAGEDRVHRSGADSRAEQLLAELHHVTPGDAVAYRERRDGRLETGSKRALGDLCRQLAARALTTAWATYSVTLVLGELDLDHG